jgi:hypothetical protein
MRKEKPKRELNPNQVEFVSPLPISECISRIEKVFKPQGCWQRLFALSVRVNFLPIDAENCEFFISKQSTVELRGKLIYQDNTSTLVICHSSISLGMKITYAIFALFGIIALMASFGGGEGPGFFFCHFLGAMDDLQLLPSNTDAQ